MISRRLARQFSKFKPAVLPDLKYDYGDLTPAVSARIMELHHSKHHQTYINNYNAAVETLLTGAETGNAQAVQALNSAIKFNGGGHVNHTLFWENLAPASREGGSLADADSKFSLDLVNTFGNYDSFIEQFNAQTAAVQGSGWGWLVLNK